MQSLPLTTQDEELISVAKETLKRLYKKNWHGVAAAIRTKQGTIYSAIHLEASIGRIAVCGEAVALGKAISEGETEFDCIVAVWYPKDDTTQPPTIAPPCGMCRELLSDYQSDLQVITQEGATVRKVPIAALIPNKCDHEYNR
jgi:cytidine deaminase